MPERVPAADVGGHRILIIDDSAVARAVIARAIDASGRWAVSRAVPTVAAAMTFLATAAVDIILLDINLPGIDGLTALPDLLAAAPGARVVVVSSAAVGVQALALGAAEVVAKPGGSAYSASFAASLLEALQRLDAPDLPLPAAPARRSPALAVVAPIAAGADFDVVAIGASTGGIHALGALLRELPASCRMPIFVTQHLPATFMPYFAAQLALLAGRPCDVATDRSRVRPGRLVVAPGDAHIVFVRLGDGSVAVRLSHEPSASGCTPSVDPMLASLAEIHRERLCGVMLSGMGRDGAEGARAVRAAGGCMLVQDAASSVIWGMPGAVVAAGAADAVLPPDAIGRHIAASRRPQ